MERWIKRTLGILWTLWKLDNLDTLDKVDKEDALDKVGKVPFMPLKIEKLMNSGVSKILWVPLLGLTCPVHLVWFNHVFAE